MIRWEAVALTLAETGGITVPEHELHVIEDRPVLVVRRFDRDASGRVGYLSAVSMLQAKDGERASYLEIAEAIEERRSGPRHGAPGCRAIQGLGYAGSPDHRRGLYGDRTLARGRPGDGS